MVWYPQKTAVNTVQGEDDCGLESEIIYFLSQQVFVRQLRYFDD